MSVTLKSAAEHLKRIGYSNTFASNTVLVREALERGITVTKTERFNYVQLEFFGKVHKWRAGRSSLTKALARRVTRYRDVTSALLNSQGVRTAENILIDSADVDRGWAWARSFDATALKSNIQRKESGTNVPIESETEFRELFAQRVGSGSGPILVERFYHGATHRCLLVNGRVVAAAHLRPASVLGNGSSTIAELVKEKNTKRKGFPAHRSLPTGKGTHSFLSSQGLTSDFVPADGERVTISPASSPRGGGDAIDVSGALTVEQTELVESAVRVIPGLAIAEVDAIFRAEGESRSPVILGINANPQISMYHQPWEGTPQDVASAVLDAMFPDS